MSTTISIKSTLLYFMKLSRFDGNPFVGLFMEDGGCIRP